MRRVNFTIGLCSMLLLISSMAGANAIMINDRTTFEALGSIDYNYGFDDFGSGLSFPSDPWTSHGVTYTNDDNLIIGPQSIFTTNGTPMMANNLWDPVSGNVDASQYYDLFGFDAGYMYSDDISTTIRITTNLNNYSFVVDLNSAEITNFYGFAADFGEYVTAFRIDTIEHDALPGIDNVTLGHQNPTPEPTTVLLVGSGLIGLVGFRWRYRKR